MLARYHRKLMADGERFYSVEEARALVPQVRAILLQLAVERRRADDAHEALHRRLDAEPDDDPQHEAQLEARTERLRAGVHALLGLLESMGIVLRDVETGLVDVPTLRDGEPVWLCWRLSDPDLAFWHTTREGFASRRPL
jgi:hypothetical protein